MNWLQIVITMASCFGSGFLLHKLLIGRKQFDVNQMQTAWNIGEIGFMTGYFGDITKDPKKFIEHLERYGFVDPTGPDGGPEFSVADPELEQLLNLSVDMARGQANQDTAMWWLGILDKVLNRLRPDEAPFRMGKSSKDKQD